MRLKPIFTRAHIHLPAVDVKGLACFSGLLVKVMFTGIIDIAAVALEAQSVAIQQRSAGMHIMAVAATDRLGVHFALDKGAVNIHLIQYLAVWKI